MDMPIDIFLEIASWSHPMTLIQLSRTSKGLRDMLMSKTARMVWRAALYNIPDLPPCAPDLAEPRYAALVFDKICLACSVDKATCVSYTARVRFCAACFRVNVVPGHRRFGSRFNDGRHSALSAGETIFSLVPRVVRESYMHIQRQNSSWDLYFLPELDFVDNKLSQLHGTADGSISVQEFIRTQKQLAQERYTYGLEVHKWENSSKLEQSRRQHDAQMGRTAQIEANLYELGYSTLDFPTDNPVWDNILNQPRQLTPRIWSQIKPKLIRMIDEAREDAIHEKLEERVEERCQQIKAHYDELLQTWADTESKDMMPTGMELCLLPPFQELARRNQAHGEISVEHFMDVFDSREGQHHLELYEIRVKKDLVTMLRKRNPNVASEQIANQDGEDGQDMDFTLDSALSRPDALFECVRHSCWRTVIVEARALDYRGIHAHWRSTHPNAPWGTDPETGETWPPAVITDKRKKTWRHNGIPAYIRPASAEIEVISPMLKIFGVRGPEYMDATMHRLDALVRAGQLICMCGNPCLPAPEQWSWIDMVRHVSDEQQWYKDMTSQRKPRVNLHDSLRNDHDLAGPPFLRYFSPEEAYDVRRQRTDRTSVPAQIPEGTAEATSDHEPSCKICLTSIKWPYRWGHLAKLRGSAAFIAYHMEAKHGQEYDPGSGLVEY
ncbi:hypothetical protein CERSUDRAFT_124209 [Gelatoporia subvermispora B]|uniref:F-box domain-containing protein n=1 Tax=Ceriporiopsis subvermispora (strain B) TaxID=914234 RepID=M2QVZ9_CERS8|nr:hypothetical protein CERSUDRAFT_124209 [Gelatoporia subvermispora B]